jgi:hypothetical protein
VTADSFLCLTASQLQLRQLGDVGGDAPGFVAGEEVRRCATAGLVLEIDVGERLPVVIADDDAGVGLLGRPGRRAAAIRAGHGIIPARHLDGTIGCARRLQVSVVETRWGVPDGPEFGASGTLRWQGQARTRRVSNGSDILPNVEEESPLLSPPFVSGFSQAATRCNGATCL